jgi:hypothetical protein
MKTMIYLITILLLTVSVSCNKCEDYKCERFTQVVEYRRDTVFPNQPWGSVRETITSDIEKFSVCTMKEVNDVMKQEVISEQQINVTKKLVTESVCFCQ